MKTKYFGLFAFLLLLPILSNAQLTYPPVLTNELDQTPIGPSARKIVVLIHGWTGKISTDLPIDYNRYLDANDSPELNYLYHTLRFKLSGSDWKFVAYRWEKDASTGFIDFGGIGNFDVTGYSRATQAALNARDHGTQLGNLLSAPDSNAPRLIHFIAHSAGAWAAREAMRVVLEKCPYAVVQLTLLDPFIPDALHGMSTGLSTGLMSAASNLTGNDRVLSMENYYADDFPVSLRILPTLSTQERFTWRPEKDLNLSVEWGAVPYPNFFASVHYKYHSGPVEFYADSASGLIPAFQDATGLIGPPYDSSQVGWYRSLFMNESRLPRIITQPTNPPPTLQGVTATLKVVANRASSYLWFRNGVSTGVTTPSIDLLAISANEGDYVVRVSNGAGQVFSDKARFSVATASTTPTITAVSPRCLVGLSLPQTQRMTILGTLFTPSSTLTFSDGANSYPARTPLFISPTELKYDIAVGTQAGTWTVKVVNGTAESDPFAFTVTAATDTTAPAAPIGLSASAWASDGQITLDWTNPSDPSGIAKAWMKIGSAPISATDGVAYRLPANKPLRASLPVSEGGRTVHLWLEDGAGNRDHNNRATISVGTDATSPVVQITSPAANLPPTTQGTITLSGTYSDNLSGVTAVRWRNFSAGVNGDATMTGTALNGSWATPTITLAPGLNVIGITATDGAGNIGTASLQVIYATPANSSTVTVSITPPEAVTQGAQWRINAGEWRNSGYVEQNIATGPRFIDFKNIPGGYRTPAGFSVNVAAGQSVAASGTYTPVFVADPPSTPGNPVPAHGTPNVGRVQPRFSWTGGAASGEVEFLFCLDPGNPTSTDPAPYGAWGPAQSFQYTGTLLPATTYNWRVKTRANGVTVDGPLWRFTTEYAMADLAVKDLSLDGNVEPGANVTLSVTVTNQGNFVAPVGYLYFYLSRQPGGKEIRLNPNNSLVINPPLQPGQFTNIIFAAKLDGLPAGQSFIDAWVDTTQAGATSESNFDNNLQTIQLNYIDGKNPDVSFVGLGNTLPKTGGGNSIVYFAKDDVGIKTMDFYYSVDGGLNWIVLQEGYVPPASPTYGASYPWQIPSNAPLITNLFVRAVARDASGNAGERIAGPYTVLDGTPPTVTILSPNGGEVWSTGSSQTIRWTSSAANGIQGMNLYVYYGGSARSIAHFTDGNNGSYQWIVPSDISASDARIRISLTDNKGNDATDYSDNTFAIQDTSIIPLPWPTPAVLTTVAPSDPSGKAHSNPRIAVESNGTVHMVYLYRSDYGLPQTIKYMKRVGTTWSSPVSISSANVASLEIAVDYNGLPHVVWGTANANMNLTDIYYSWFNGSIWSTPMNISDIIPGAPGQTPSWTPRIDISRSNTVQVVWTELNVGGIANNLFQRSKTAENVWSAISQITTTGGAESAIKHDSHNNLHLVYRTGSDMKYMRQIGAAWSVATTALTTPNLGSMELAADASDNLHMVFHAYDGTIFPASRILYSRPLRNRAAGIWFHFLRCNMTSAVQFTRSVACHRPVPAPPWGCVLRSRPSWAGSAGGVFRPHAR